MTIRSSPRSAWSSLKIATLALTCAFCWTAPGSAEPNDDIRIPLDLGGDPQRIRDYIMKLRDSRPAVWREAQIRLAVSGPVGLVELEAASVATEPEARPRLKRLLSLALLTTVTPADLNRHAGLSTLGAAEIARGFALAETLASLPVFDFGESGFLNPDFSSPPPTPVQRVLAEFGSLGGFMVPAAIQLCADRRPVARAYGALMLRNIAIAAEHVRPLLADPARIMIVGSDWSGDGTVAEVMGPRFGSRSSVRQSDRFEEVLWRMDILNGAYDGMFDLTNGIRQTSVAMDAATWDEWWEAARPAWMQWWKLAGSGIRPPDREEWLHYLRKFKGVHPQRR